MYCWGAWGYAGGGECTECLLCAYIFEFLDVFCVCVVLVSDEVCACLGVRGIGLGIGNVDVEGEGGGGRLRWVEGCCEGELRSL